MGTLVLLRHGESVWNAKGLFTGWVDVDLSATGEDEARRGGELLKDAGVTPDVLHTSLLKRAKRSHRVAAVPEFPWVKPSHPVVRLGRPPGTWAPRRHCLRIRVRRARPERRGRRRRARAAAAPAGRPRSYRSSPASVRCVNALRLRMSWPRSARHFHSLRIADANPRSRAPLKFSSE